MVGTLNPTMWEEVEAYFQEAFPRFSGLACPRGDSIARRGPLLDEGCRGLHQLCRPQQSEPSMFAVSVPVFARDLYLTVINKYEGPTMLIDEARNRVE